MSWSDRIQKIVHNLHLTVLLATALLFGPTSFLLEMIAPYQRLLISSVKHT